MKKSTKTIIVITAAVLVVGAVGAIYAYLRDSESKANKFTAADNEIIVDESFPDKEKTQKFNETVYSKEAGVKNKGNTASYVRVFAEFQDSDTAKKSYLSYDGTNYYSASDPTHAPDSDITLTDGTILNKDFYTDNIVTLSNNDWVYRDGWYYYTKPLEPNVSTGSLFKNVIIYNQDANAIAAADLYVYAESVQTCDAEGKPYSEYSAVTAQNPAYIVAFENYFSSESPSP